MYHFSTSDALGMVDANSTLRSLSRPIRVCTHYVAVFSIAVAVLGNIA